MKKFFTFMALVLFSAMLNAQAVQRSYVVLEIGTGTWCTYCPGAANGAHDLLANGKQVAVIENHNGDPFANTASNARNSYYSISGYPTANFDGTFTHVGGAACPNGNSYSSYLNYYNQAYAVQSPLKIDIAGTNSGNTYNITISMHKLAAITATDLKLHLVLTESNIATAPWPGSSGCMTQVDHVTRIFVPDHNGTSINFTNGDFQVINLTFQKDPAWVAAECELVAFVQSHGAKTIYNGMKVALNALPVPMSVDFTGSPTTGCAPVVTNYTGIAAGATNWQWNLPGGTPATSSVQNPVVTYNTAGSYDVTLTAWNSATGRGNVKTSTNFITMNAAPVAPATPQGNNSMCQNPPNVTYSIAAVSGAQSYTWDLTPPEAGVMTPAGTSCTIDFSNSWTGSAQLKVRGSNACGDGNWSAPLTITVSEEPQQPSAPTGPTQLCMNPANSDYVAAHTGPVTDYVWELLPYDAGAIYPAWNTCMVDWVNNYSGTATLKVKAVNGSCMSNWSDVLTITVNPGPTAYNVTGGGIYCGQGGNGLPIGLDDSETGVNYTLYHNGSATSQVVAGTGNSITFGNQLAVGDYTVKAANSSAGCANNMTGSATITMDPEPPQVPGEPNGPSQVYTGATPTSEYVTTGGQYSTTYSWDVTPATAGTVTGNSTTGLVAWNPVYAGPAQVRVQGVNACGAGSYSTSFEVTVDLGVGIPENSQAPRMTLSPNPAKGEVTFLSGLKGLARVILYDSFGRQVMVLHDVELSRNPVISLAKLSAGVYMVHVTTGENSEIIRLVVQ